MKRGSFVSMASMKASGAATRVAYSQILQKGTALLLQRP